MKNLLLLLAFAVPVAAQEIEPSPLDELSKLDLFSGKPAVTRPALSRGFMCLQKTKHAITLPRAVRDSVIVFYSTFNKMHIVAGFWTNGLTVTAAECEATNWYAQTGRRDVSCACVH